MVTAYNNIEDKQIRPCLVLYALSLGSPDTDRLSGADSSISDDTPFVYCKFKVKVFKFRPLNTDSQQAVQSSCFSLSLTWSSLASLLKKHAHNLQC